MRQAVRSALAWGDTSAWHDFATRVLTLSDGASTSCLPKLDGFDGPNAPWVFRAHSAAFHVPIASIHNKIDAVEVLPHVLSVGNSSWRFTCDILDAATHRAIATTRGVFVHVDEETHSRPTRIPEPVADALRRCTIESTHNPAGDALLERLDGEVAQRPHEPAIDTQLPWDILVRATDADALGHVNNAKWALFVAEALASGGGPKGGAAGAVRPIEPVALSIDYVAQAKPGDRLTCRRWHGEADGCTHLAFHLGAAPSSHS